MSTFARALAAIDRLCALGNTAGRPHVSITFDTLDDAMRFKTMVLRDMELLSGHGAPLDLRKITIGGVKVSVSGRVL